MFNDYKTIIIKNNNLERQIQVRSRNAVALIEIFPKIIKMKETYYRCQGWFFLKLNFLDKDLKIKGLERRIWTSKVEAMALQKKKRRIVDVKCKLDRDCMIFNRNENFLNFAFYYYYFSMYIYNVSKFICFFLLN